MLVLCVCCAWAGYRNPACTSPLTTSEGCCKQACDQHETWQLALLVRLECSEFRTSACGGRPGSPHGARRCWCGGRHTTGRLDAAIPAPARKKKVRMGPSLPHGPSSSPKDTTMANVLWQQYWYGACLFVCLLTWGRSVLHGLGCGMTGK